MVCFFIIIIIIIVIITIIIIIVIFFWSSQHDPDSAQCSPGGKAGNFIMYSRASDGHEPNNLLFSPCSKRQIALVISRKGADCFIGELYISLPRRRFYTLLAKASFPWYSAGEYQGQKASASRETFLGGSYFLSPLITTSLKVPAWEASYT